MMFCSNASQRSKKLLKKIPAAPTANHLEILRVASVMKLCMKRVFALLLHFSLAGCDGSVIYIRLSLSKPFIGKKTTALHLAVRRYNFMIHEGYFRPKSHQCTVCQELDIMLLTSAPHSEDGSRVNQGKLVTD